MMLFPCTYPLSWRIWGKFRIHLRQPISPSLLLPRPFFFFPLLFIPFFLLMLFNNLNVLNRDWNVMGVEIFLRSFTDFYEAWGFSFKIWKQRIQFILIISFVKPHPWRCFASFSNLLISDINTTMWELSLHVQSHDARFIYFPLTSR